MYDILNNNKVAPLRLHASQDVGASVSQLEVNFQEKDAVEGYYERSTKALLIINVSAVASGAKLALTIQDYGSDTATWVALATIEDITEAGIYICELKNFRQKIKLVATVTTDTVTWSAFAVGFDATRRPVVQPSAVEEVTVTYATT